MKLRLVILALVVVSTGCASGVDVVDEPGEERLEAMTRYDVEQQDVQFDAADTTVHATLTLPEGVDDAPAVVLVAGSGPTDRDWNNPLLPGTHGTAIELADGLARTGIAVLRYDKRGSGETELTPPVRWSDYLAELEAALELLAERDETDEDRIFVAGHSEGGLHALRAAVDGRVDAAGVVAMATPGRTMRELVVSQVGDQLEAVGMNAEEVDAELESLRDAMDAVQQGDDVDPRDVSQIDGIASLVETLQAPDTRDFAAELLDWNPADAARRLRRPLLIVNGLADTRIDPEDDAGRLHEAARQNNDDVRLALIEQADHVLKYQPLSVEEVGSEHTLTYNDPTRRLNRGALDVIASWIHRH